MSKPKILHVHLIFAKNVGFGVWSWNKAYGSFKRTEEQLKRGSLPLYIGLAGALVPIFLFLKRQLKIGGMSW